MIYFFRKKYKIMAYFARQRWYKHLTLKNASTFSTTYHYSKFCSNFL